MLVERLLEPQHASGGTFLLHKRSYNSHSLCSMLIHLLIGIGLFTLNRPEARPASCTMGTGSFPVVKRPGRGADTL